MRIFSYFIVFMLLMCMGCGQRSGDGINMYDDKTIGESKIPEGITMSIGEISYPTNTDKVIVTIKNNSSHEFYAGSDYHLEYYNGTTWSKVPINFVTTDVAFSLFPKKTKDFDIYLHPEQYKYQPGKYKVYKTISTTLKINDPERKTYELTAQFSME